MNVLLLKIQAFNFLSDLFGRLECSLLVDWPFVWPSALLACLLFVFADKPFRGSADAEKGGRWASKAEVLILIAVMAWFALCCYLETLFLTLAPLWLLFGTWSLYALSLERPIRKNRLIAGLILAIYAVTPLVTYGALSQWSSQYYFKLFSFNSTASNRILRYQSRLPLTSQEALRMLESRLYNRSGVLANVVDNKRLDLTPELIRKIIDGDLKGEGADYGFTLDCLRNDERLSDESKRLLKDWWRQSRFRETL